MKQPDAPAPAKAGDQTQLAGRTVLQIIPELDAGGAERTTIDVAAALAEAGARPLVAAEGGRLVSELQARGGVWIPFPARTKNPLAMAAAVPKLARLIREEGVDIVHARSRAPAWVALAATRMTRTPFVTTYHGSYAGRSSVKVAYNSVMARGDVVIANSEYTAGLIAELHPVGRDRVRVIHRGTDFRKFAAGAVDPARVLALRNAWSIEPDDRIVLLSARLTAWKGHRVLIEAAKRLTERGVADVRYILAGDDQGRSAYVREIDAAIARKNLDGIVRRVGHCEDMPAAYLASAVVAVPSTEPEAFGRVAVEAQAIGTPVVSTDLGAAPETVLAPPRAPAAERTGWTVPPDDPQALADALFEALSLGATARDNLARRARAHVLKHFSLEQMIGQTLDCYVALLQNGPQRA
ncbi:MAG: glycosyltransferase family 4 protein [Methylobacteriaceae bacterium]|nr:glycosyltransferase family 4 protein [Methylobacteriaceae bacterium]